MGTALSVIRGLDQSPEYQRKANDALNSLETLAGLKAQEFYSKVESGNADHLLIPVDRILYRDIFIQANVVHTTANIKSKIQSTMQNFIHGDIVDGITNLVGAGLDFVFGNYSANQAEHEFYAITTGESGGIMRLDTQVFSYEFTSSALTSVASKVVAVSVVVSSAKTDSLNDNTLLDIVQMCYGSTLDSTKVDKIYNVLKTRITPKAEGSPA